MARKGDRQPHRFSADRSGFRRWRRMKALFSIAFSCILVGGIALVVLVLYLRAQALPVSAIQQTTEIYDVHGELIDSLYNGQNRQLVSLDEISPYLQQATLAIEDHRFYEHPGFDLMGLGRAVWVDLQHMSRKQGASTITQQLARNLYLTQEKTWTRKIREAFYTIQLETRYSKKEILTQYLNQIYYGHAAYGAEAASELYFGKPAAELTLAESALLAGVPKGPKYYSPYMDMDNAKARQKTVLQAMAEYGYITPQEADQAAREELRLLPLQGNRPSKAPYFEDYVRQLTMDRLHISESEFNEGGYKIYTTLDLSAQQKAEAAISRTIPADGDLQAALVAIDPRTGYIKAMVGGKDYGKNQFNRVFADTRQPGSSFKAILYLTALQQDGFSETTRFKSTPTIFTYDEGRRTYSPSNFGDHYSNEDIDLRRAIAESDNIFAVHTIMQIGPEKVVEMARKLGIDSPMRPLPSLALGTFPVSPFEMAGAFATIANQGARIEPVAILKIEKTDGTALYESRPQQQQVVDPAYTYVLTHLLESVFEPGGTGYRVASTIKRPVAGKTGTTDTDAWMVGFTPELAAAVWVGYDRDRDISATESHLASPIFADFIEQTLQSVPPKMFPIPDGVVSAYIDPETGLLATADCPQSRLENFVKGTEPKEYCSAHGKPLRDEPSSPPEGKKENSWWEDLKRWWND